MSTKALSMQNIYAALFTLLGAFSSFAFAQVTESPNPASLRPLAEEGVLASRSQVGPCLQEWMVEFPPMEGLAGVPSDFALFDDGNGEALFVAGTPNPWGNGDAGLVSKWNGSAWEPIGDHRFEAIFALEVFDDGNGAELYAVGSFDFTSASGASISNIAKWNGVRWAPVGGGLNHFGLSLTTWNDGTGEALFVGGRFTAAGGVSGADRIAKWDGTSWFALGSGVEGPVLALEAFDDGGGEELYVGGSFSAAGGMPSANIAKWDGASWDSLGVGVGDDVRALAVHNDGGGDVLFAGGLFVTAGGGFTGPVAKWDGSNWSGLDGGVFGNVSALFPFDPGSGERLYLAGNLSLSSGNHGLATWDGVVSSPVVGVGGSVTVLAANTTSSGSELLVGGLLPFDGGAISEAVGTWDGATFDVWGTGPLGIQGEVHSLAVFDDGSGRALYAAGDFSVAGGQVVDNIAVWKGQWVPLVGGGVAGRIHSLKVYDDGTGPGLYAGGHFDFAGGIPVNNLAKWDGAAWHSVGAPTVVYHSAPAVEVLEVYDDGGGPELYVGGSFRVTMPGGVTASNIVKYDGASWTPVTVGQGGGSVGPRSRVQALAAYDLGAGPALAVGGPFITVDDQGSLVSARLVATWDGSSWASLGLGFDTNPQGTVSALAPFDDGNGTQLYAGGLFNIGGVPANIAKTTGLGWSGVSPIGLNGNVITLRVLDDGSGAQLFAGGNFQTANGAPVWKVAKWNGAQWGSLDGGVTSLPANANGPVNALAVFDDGRGPRLYVAGRFAGQGRVFADNVASWGCVPLTVGVPFCDPAEVNGTGQPAVLEGYASASSASGLHLEVLQGMPMEFGYLLIGSDAVEPGIWISQGRLCLSSLPGAFLGRYNVSGTSLNSLGVFDELGRLNNLGGNAEAGFGYDTPLEVPNWPNSIQAGDTWNFQCWYREPGGLSNFSNGLSVTF